LNIHVISKEEMMAQRLRDTERFRDHAVRHETAREHQLQLRQVAIERLQMQRDKKFASLDDGMSYSNQAKRMLKSQKITEWYDREYNKIWERFKDKC
jgi:hypothetical protein